MEEMKKFLRYVVPGLVVVVEFIGILALFLFLQNRELLKLYISNIIKYGKNAEGFGIAFSIFLLSGGLGALLATAYHNLISSRWIDELNVDYSELLTFCHI